MSVHIKICGITNKEDAENAISLGVNAIGFIFHESSPRYVSPEEAEEITMELPPFVQSVGVFVDRPKDEVVDVIKRCRLDVVQLHGNETTDYCMEMPRRVIKAFRVSEPEDLQPISNYQGVVSAILLDTKIKNIEGGTGQTFDWGLAIQAKEYDVPLILAGGIQSSNVRKALELVRPYAVDLSSGLESEPGKKDYNKMAEFVNLVKGI